MPAGLAGVWANADEMGNGSDNDNGMDNGRLLLSWQGQLGSDKVN